MKFKSSILIAMICLSTYLTLHAQMSGGPITITNSVVSSGGGTTTGSSIHIDAAIAQPAVGPELTGGTITINSGFFAPGSAPTAAHVAVSGRVVTQNGVGLRNAIVHIDDGHGIIRQAPTSSFGYFRIEDVPAGGTYIISVISKRYRFDPRLVTITDDLTDLEFNASSKSAPE